MNKKSIVLKALIVLLSFISAFIISINVIDTKKEDKNSNKNISNSNQISEGTNVFNFEQEIKLKKKIEKEAFKIISNTNLNKKEPIISNFNSNINSNFISSSNSNKSNKIKEKSSNKNNDKSNESKSNKTSNKKDKTSNENQKNYISKVPVFTFHRLVPDDIKKKYYKTNEWVGSIDIFEEMMKYLHDNNYKTISTLELYDWYKGKKEYTEKVVVITFDDGYIEDYYLAYPILKKYNLKSTSFLVGINTGDKTIDYNGSDEFYSKNTQAFIGKDIINKVKKEYPNFDFQSHSYNFHSKINVDGKRVEKVYIMTEDELEDDVVKSLQFGFKTMAYPFGANNKSIRNKLKNHGYLLAFTFGGNTYGYSTRKSNQYAMNRIKIDGNADLNTLKKWLDY